MKTYFTEKEFNQEGKVVYDKMNPLFINKLNQARSYSSMPWNITSSWRDPIHNKEVGGSETSSHLKGVAVDIFAGSSKAKWIIVTALLRAGFTRIGIGSNFIHVDMDMEKTQNVIWTY
jgi:uncharacterized protein YcbK (DUF882 family)